MKPSLPVMLLCLVSLPCLAAEQHFDFEVTDENGGPSGWKLSANQCAASLDERIRTDGEKSLNLDCTHQSGGEAFIVAGQSIGLDPSRTGQVTLSGDLRFADVMPGHTGLWLRVDGAEGMLKLENMSGQMLGGTTDWAHYRTSLRFPKESTAIAFGALLSGDGQVWADNLTINIAYDDKPPELSAELRGYLDTALDIIVENSISKPDDVDAFRREAIEDAQGSDSIMEIQTAIVNAIRRSGDNHSHILSDSAASHHESDGSSADVRDIRTRLVADHVAVLEVPAVSTGNSAIESHFVDNAHQSLIELDGHGICGWVVDLRMNHGGNMWPMLAALGPLLGGEEVGAFANPNGDQDQWRYRAGIAWQAGKVPTFSSSMPPTIAAATAPLAVLIGNGTASSGEMTAVALKGRPDTRFFGSRTAGFISALKEFELPDGALLYLATSIVQDRSGKRYPDAVEPDVQIASSNEDGKDLALMAATEWLESLPACVFQYR